MTCDGLTAALTLRGACGLLEVLRSGLTSVCVLLLLLPPQCCGSLACCAAQEYSEIEPVHLLHPGRQQGSLQGAGVCDLGAAVVVLLPC
jgi:hypothetical protein